MRNQKPTRRTFLRQSAGALMAAPFASAAIAHAAAPNETLNVAGVGVGGKGDSDLRSVAGAKNVRVVALCDVDANRLGAMARDFPKATRFRDFRKMYDQMAGDIDAVVCATPDHMHGPVALGAMARGKHVYCEKPLAHNLTECRAMQEAADKHSVVTQMGTQIHSHSAYRTAVAAVRSGAIGKVREVHLWVGSDWGDGKTGAAVAPPDYLDWDLWLGVAPKRPYVDGAYHPMEWRRFTDFGCGTLGDMGCHIFDPVFTALELAPPTAVVSHGPKVGDESFTRMNDVRFTFAETPYTDGPIVCRWTDGGRRPDASNAQLPSGVELPGGGSYMVGEKGVMVLPHVDSPQFYSNGAPMELKIDTAADIDHYHEWADACRGVGTSSTPFSYACPVTETVLTGVVAGRFPKTDLAWNSAGLTFDDDAANTLIRRSYREGWEIPLLVNRA